MTSMRALGYDSYGSADVLRIREVSAPTPGPGQLCVRVRAAALNLKDVLERKGRFKLFTGGRLPRIPGYDFSGEVESLGADVTGFALGDRVHGLVGGFRAGACAELLVVDASAVAPMPSVTFEAAAAVPLAALTALQALRDLAHVCPGDRVCVNGASGGVGSFAIQVAVQLGGEVTAIASGRNEALVRGLGAKHFVDYTGGAPSDGAAYDVFFDVFGNWPFARARRLLKRDGRHVTTLPSPRAVARDLISRVWRGKRARLVVVRPRRADLDLLSAWIDEGTLTPTIDRVLPWTEAAEAHAYLETKRARGKVVLMLD